MGCMEGELEEKGICEGECERYMERLGNVNGEMGFENRR